MLPRASAAVVGAIAAALCLVKINVGAFAVLAVVFAWAAGLAPRWRRFALPAMAGAMTLAPLVLMAGLLSRGWVLEFAVLVSLSAAAGGDPCLPGPPPRQAATPPLLVFLGGRGFGADHLVVGPAGGPHPARPRGWLWPTPPPL